MSTIDWGAWKAQEPGPDFASEVIEAVKRDECSRISEMEKLLEAQAQLERLILSVEADLAQDSSSQMLSAFWGLVDNRGSEVDFYRMRREQRAPLEEAAKSKSALIFEFGKLVDDVANWIALDAS